VAPLGCHVDVLDLARWSRNRQAIFAHALDVKRDGLADLTLHLRHSDPSGHATRKIGNVGRVVAFGLLNHDCIAHTTSRLQTGLLKNAVQGARGKIIVWLARNSDSTGFGWVFELAMATAGSDKIPAIRLQQAQNFANFHRSRISGRADATLACEPVSLVTPNV